MFCLHFHFLAGYLATKDTDNSVGRALHNPRVKERGKEQAAAKLHDLTSGSEADDDGSDFEE